MNESNDLIRSLDELTSALLQHNQYLEQHNTTMVNLTMAIKQLDMTISKESKSANSGPSLQLKQTITTFVDAYINPQYYQTYQYTKLIETTKLKLTRLLPER